MRSRLFGLLLLASGCGSAAANSAPDLIPVTGLVTLDDKPIAGVTVMFNPLQGTKGTGAYGVTDAEGRYKLLHRSEHEGCQEGAYGVTFSKITQPDGSPLPKDADRATVGMVEQIPAAYTVFDPYAFVEQAKVAKPSASADFKLSSKKKVSLR